MVSARARESTREKCRRRKGFWASLTLSSLVAPFCPPALQSALFDFTNLLVVLLLLVCSAAYARALTYRRDPATGAETSALDDAGVGAGGGVSVGGDKRPGLKGLAWKFARVGERLSPWVALACLLMAVHVLFIKA